MKEKCSVKQIVGVLKQAEIEVPLAELTLDKTMLQDGLRKVVKSSRSRPLVNHLKTRCPSPWSLSGSGAVQDLRRLASLLRAIRTGPMPHSPRGLR